MHFISFSFAGTDLGDPSNGIRRENSKADMAYRRYEGKINDIIRYMNHYF